MYSSPISSESSASSSGTTNNQVFYSCCSSISSNNEKEEDDYDHQTPLKQKLVEGAFSPPADSEGCLAVVEGEDDDYEHISSKRVACYACSCCVAPTTAESEITSSHAQEGFENEDTESVLCVADFDCEEEKAEQSAEDFYQDDAEQDDHLLTPSETMRFDSNNNDGTICSTAAASPPDTDAPGTDGEELLLPMSNGPLPPNWEVAYTSDGEKYYIE
jgi:hypothetical protein